MATRPTINLLNWVAAAKRTEPDAGLQTSGYDPGDKPTAPNLNFVFATLSGWVTYFASAFDGATLATDSTQAMVRRMALGSCSVTGTNITQDGDVLTHSAAGPALAYIDVTQLFAGYSVGTTRTLGTIRLKFDAGTTNTADYAIEYYAGSGVWTDLTDSPDTFGGSIGNDLTASTMAPNETISTNTLYRVVIDFNSVDAMEFRELSLDYTISSIIAH